MNDFSIQLTRKVNGIKELVAIWSSTSLSPVGEGHLQIYPVSALILLFPAQSAEN